MRLTLPNSRFCAAGMRVPAYEVAALTTGIVHLGVGAFQRAHSAVFNDDAIEVEPGAWGIIGVSMRRPDVADELLAQDGLYTVEILGPHPTYRVIGSLRQALCLPREPEAVLAAIAAPATKIITLTVTEKGYCLRNGHLDTTHAEIEHDWRTPDRPRSAIGALTSGLIQRYRGGGRPVTVISCDNLVDNGARLRAAVCEFAQRVSGDGAAWIAAEVAFPDTMVDCIVPATDAASRGRVANALGLDDRASVMREDFAQWVIENRFAGPAPAWVRAGAEIVPSVRPFRRLKLHVLNAAHSALAYLGLRRGHAFVRQAVADPEIRAFLEALIEREIAPGMPDLDVHAYWSVTLQRFANPMLDHRLDQIAADGIYKLAQRIYPLMVGNLRAGLPIRLLGAIVQEFLAFIGCRERTDYERYLDDPNVFPDEFRSEPKLREAVLRLGDRFGGR